MSLIFAIAIVIIFMGLLDCDPDHISCRPEEKNEN